MVKNITDFAPGVITTRSGDTRIRPVRSRNAATPSRRAGMPGAGTSCVWPASSAAAAASQMCGAVGKSGSPISRWITV